MSRRFFSPLSASRTNVGRAKPKRRTEFAEQLDRRALLSVSLSLSGAQTLSSTAAVNVSNFAGFNQAEMQMDINPTNPLNLVGFSHRDGSFNNIDVYFSTNGGDTWARRTINDGTSGGINDGLGAGFRFDPAIAFDANGVVYVAYGNDNGPNTNVVVARSLDGGNTFGQFRTLATNADFGTLKGNDKWYLATGRDPVSGNQALYVAWTQNVQEPGTDQRIVLTGSRDGGNTFFAPFIVNDKSLAGSSAGNLYACPAVGPNGEAYVSWHDINANEIRMVADPDGIWNGANGFSADRVARTVTSGSLFGYIVPAMPSRGISNAPMIKVDRSFGPNRGRVYINYTERFGAAPSIDTDIKIIRSDNGGANWSAPISVDSSGGTEFNNWLDIDPKNGSVAVFYRSTQGNATTAQVRSWNAISLDGGTTWTRAAVSSQLSDETGGNTNDYLEYEGFAYRDGTAHSFWSSRYTGGGTDLDIFSVTTSFISSTLGNILNIVGDDFGANTSDTITIRNDPANASFIDVIVNGILQYAGTWVTLDRININGGGGADTINIEANRIFAPVTVAPTGSTTDTINLGNSTNGMQDIGGDVTLLNNPSFNNIFMNDGASPFARNFTQDTVIIGGDSYGQVTGLAAGTIRYKYNDTSTVTITAGSAVDTANIINIQRTLTLSTSGGNDIVNVGNNTNGLQGIVSALTIVNPPAFSVINLSNNFDSVARTVTHDTVNIGGSDYGRFTGLAPSTIDYKYGDTNSVSLTMGSGADVINILRTGRPITYTTVSSVDTINVGNGTNGVQGIFGALQLNNPSNFNVVNVNDGANTFARSWSHDNVQVSGFTYGRISGLAPATIDYRYADTTSCTITNGSGLDTAAILGAAGTLTISNTLMRDNVNFGNPTNGLQSIFGIVTVTNPPSFSNISLDDSADTGARAILHTTVNIAGSDFGQFTGFAPGTIRYKYADAASVAMTTGSNGDSVTIAESSTVVPILFRASAGPDAIAVNPDGLGFAALYFNQTQAVQSLSISAGGRGFITAGSATVLTTNALTIAAGGILDMANNAMIVDYTGPSPLATVGSYLQSGYAAGAWTGNGINSSTAAGTPGRGIGYGEATAIGSPATFLGQPIDNTSVLLRYTLYGDADLSGSVNLDDFTRLAAAFGTASVWTGGDFGYNGSTSLDDFTALAANFGQTLPASQPRVVGVPNPALLGMTRKIFGSVEVLSPSV